MLFPKVLAMQAILTYRPFGGFRLLLATLVVLQHYFANLAPEPFATASSPFAAGTIAVTIFFALSGFVISEAADQVYRDRPAAFFANRLLRILPHFLLAVAASMLICFVFNSLGTLRIERQAAWSPEVGFAWRNVSFNFLSFMPVADRFISYDFLSLGWAIRTEMAFYAAFALAMASSSWARRRGFASVSFFRVATGLATAGMALAVLATIGRAPPMFQFAPYFVYGGALYVFVARRNRFSLAVAAVALAGMAFQLWRLPIHNIAGNFDRSSPFDSAAFVVLLGLMTALAFLELPRFRRIDRFFGDLTYPLYMSHVNVMIFVLSVTTGYSSAALLIGLALNLVVTPSARALLDPAVDRLRDAVRGTRLSRIDKEPHRKAPVDFAQENRVAAEASI